MWSRYLGRTLYLDSNVVIFAVEAGNPWTEMLHGLFQHIDDGSISAMTSELTLAEVLVRPLAAGADDLVAMYERVLGPDSTIDVLPVDRKVLRAAASLRGALGVQLMDAIHVATARRAACEHFVSNDVRLGRKLGAAPACLSLEGPERGEAAGE